ncbi:Uncharacterized conserved protein [Marinitoga hydrogenitolerans DSM 16785]|uniref:Uncharacterized conserved protein n=1 Tax=Marinitoga hydrogenitolerans (strain DSM 16785 / JCM 12826 / AT1271) TaxID=1122195 RepID=A0A1M4XZT4_MARH1|nr:hypothetical protein [Marinitoga hydrogenitolerans]SHE98955.1 Uncharacterized conserved protein [Marinitoga hydrogenitolerans DSM 16785]
MKLKFIILAISAFILAMTGVVILPIVFKNDPPSIPELYSPINGATEIPVNAVFTWNASDPNGDSLTYDIYLSTEKDKLTPIASNLTETSFSKVLNYNKTYYWKVVAKDKKDATDSDIWFFSTENSIPLKPHSPNPKDGEINVPLIITLNWKSEDLDGDKIYYDVYLGRSIDTMKPIATALEEPSIEVNLKEDARYYWKVVAKDGHGGIRYGDIWAFQTKSVKELGVPFEPTPTNGATELETNLTLKWKYEGKEALFDIYLGVEPQNMSLIAQNLGYQFYDVSVDFGKNYYWKVIAKSGDEQKESSIWNFSTKKILISEEISELSTQVTVESTTVTVESSILTQEATVGIFEEITDNKKYVYTTGSGIGMYIIDVSDPKKPKIVNHVYTEGWAVGLYVRDKHAYIADWINGVVVADISDIKNPIKVGKLKTFGKVYSIFVKDNIAYILEGSSGMEIAKINKDYSLTSASYLELKGASGRIFVENNYAYIPMGYDGFVIVDVSDEKIPKLLSYFDADGFAYNVVVENDIAYLADGGVGLKIIDVKDKEHLKLISKVDIKSEWARVFFDGNIVFYAEGEKGFSLIDVSNKEKPILLSAVDTKGFCYGGYISDNYLYIADGENGLLIYDISDPEKPILLSNLKNLYLQNIILEVK